MKGLRPFLGARLCLWPAIGAPQAPPPVVSPAPVQAPALDMLPAQALAHRAKELQKAILNERPDAVEAAVGQVEAMRLRYSILDVTPLVEAMALWARDRGLDGRPELGLQALGVVDRWAPGHPTLLGTRITLLRQQGISGWFLSLPDLLRLTRLRFEHPANRWLWLMQHVASLRLMVTLLIWGWSLALAVRYRNVLRDLWEEKLRDRNVSPAMCAILGAILLTLPLIAGLDPTYMAYWWLWLLAPFMHSGEVRATAFIVLLQLLHPAVGFMEPLAQVHPEPSIVTLQVQPQAKAIHPQDLKGLTEGDQAFLRGWRQLQQGDWAAAEATFEPLLQTHPDKGAVLNNLGVARFQKGDRAKAEQDFMEAGLLASGRVEVLLNQSVVHFTKLETEKGTEKQDEARSADPAYFAKLVAISGDHNEPRTFAMPLPDTPERVKALQGGIQNEEAPNPLRQPFFLVTLIAPVLAFILIIARVRSSIRSAHASQCIRCGEPFHTTDSNNPEVCTKCHHLFTLKDGLHQESRKKKIDEVATHQAATRRFHKALIFLLPGCDLTFLGDSKEGFIEWLLICIAAGMVFATGRTVRYPGEVLADPVSTWLPLGMAFLVLLYLRNWFKLIPRGRRGA
jgi:tetratricopeptide (TPR) repeat protein